MSSEFMLPVSSFSSAGAGGSRRACRNCTTDSVCSMSGILTCSAFRRCCRFSSMYRYLADVSWNVLIIGSTLLEPT